MKHHAQETSQQFGDVRRLGYRPTFSNLDCVTRGASPCDGVKCFGFFGSGDKTQSTTNSQIGASEEAQLQYVTGSNTSSGGILSTTGSNLSNVNITQTDGGAFDFARDIVGEYKTTLSNFIETNAGSADKQNSLLAGLVNSFGSLVESKNTDGASSQNKTVLYIGLAIAFVFAVFFFRRR